MAIEELVLTMSFLLFFSACLLGIVTVLSEPTLDLEHTEFHFERFIQQYGRQYADEEEKQVRFQIFKDNLAIAMRMNKDSGTDNYGITKFSDLTEEEFQRSYTGFISSQNCGSQPIGQELCTLINDDQIPNANAPESFDWRDHNVVTTVKNQSCGDCYTFSSVGNIEGQYAIKHKELVDLSTQQILDCDWCNGGCGGGVMARVFRTLIKSGGSQSLTDYPYKGKVSTCKLDENKVKVKLVDCNCYNLTSQEEVKQLLYKNGPISIAIRGLALRHHTHGGIVGDKECLEGYLNHAVLLVGYGHVNETGEQYWIVKNSWGADWGEKGYFRIHRGEGAFSCGMLNPDMSSAVIE